MKTAHVLITRTHWSHPVIRAMSISPSLFPCAVDSSRARRFPKNKSAEGQAPVGELANRRTVHQTRLAVGLRDDHPNMSRSDFHLDDHIVRETHVTNVRHHRRV